MRIAKKSWSIRRGELEQWHVWYAWRPVRVTDNQIAWLENVERQGIRCAEHVRVEWWIWKYRPLDERD